MGQINEWVLAGKIPDLSTWYSCVIDIDKVSKLHVNSLYEPMSLEKIPDLVRTYFDYDFADNNTKQHFMKIAINGHEEMMPKCAFIISSDAETPMKDYQKLLNVIGRTILEIRDKYARRIFNFSYAKSTLPQQEDIDVLVPSVAKYLQSPLDLAKRLKIAPHAGMSVVIWKDGMSVDGKLCTIDDLPMKRTEWIESHPEQKFNIRVTTKGGVPLDKLNKVYRELGLKNPLPMFVEQMPEFPGGQLAMRRFIANNVKYPKEAMENRIQGTVKVNFIVNKEGEVENPIIIRGIHPTLDEEAKRVILQMPRWKPGRQKGELVSVDLTVPVTFELQ